MLRSLGTILGYAVQATDGEIGKVHDFFFDDQSWGLRYLVVETGEWLRKRRVLIATAALGSPEWQGRSFPVSLTQEQVSGSPDVDTDKPVSRQHEIETNLHYGWPHYWSLEPLPISPSVEETAPPPGEAADGDPHLRSLREVASYSLHNQESELGLVDDFIGELERWIIRYLVIATGHHWPRRRVLIGPSWVTRISWAAKEVRTAITQADLGDSPEFDPAAAVNREYEVRLYDYYGRPRYWE